MRAQSGAVVAARDPEAEELDVLRRRLYRPGSTDADVRRYLAERPIAAPDPAPAAAPARPRPRLRGVLPAAALVGAVVVGLVVSIGQVHALRPSVRNAATTSPAPVLVQDIGDGDTLTVPQRASTASGSAPVSVDGVGVVGQRFEGSGDAVLVVDPPTGTTRGGAATVLLVSGGPVPVAWRALSQVYLGRWTPVSVVLAHGTSAEPPGTPTPQTFRYRDAPPTRLAVIAPEGVRWTVLVGLAGPEQGLH